MDRRQTLFFRREIEMATGFNKTLLEFFTRAGLVEPVRAELRGQSGRYTAAQLEQLALAAAFEAAGVPPRNSLLVAQALQRQNAETYGGFPINLNHIERAILPKLSRDEQRQCLSADEDDQYVRLAFAARMASIRAPELNWEGAIVGDVIIEIINRKMVFSSIFGLEKIGILAFGKSRSALAEMIIEGWERGSSEVCVRTVEDVYCFDSPAAAEALDEQMHRQREDAVSAIVVNGSRAIRRAFLKIARQRLTSQDRFA
jgi:hypothetical protein